MGIRKPYLMSWRGKNRHFATSKQLCEEVRRSHDTVLLSFSCGKDAIASWAVLLDHGFRVVPYLLELVPGLSFVEDSVVYFERHFGTKIRRMVSPSFVRMLRNLVFQPPERCAELEALRLPVLSYEDVEDRLRREYGRELPIALGTRMSDSPVRRASIRTHGALNPNRGSFLPIFDWSKKQALDRVAAEGISLPVDYEMFGRSFDGIDLRFLGPIKQRFPRDYEKILEWFPFADLEMRRRRLCPVE